MIVRNYTPDDHQTVARWWAGHRWPVIPAALLTTPGFVVETEQQPVAMGWLYLSDRAPLAMMEFVVSNPAASGYVVVRALGKLVEAIMAAAKEAGVQALFTGCQQDSLARLYQTCGFQVTDRAVTHLVATWP